MTFGDFKRELRSVVFPAGEAPNLVAAHNKAILDALIDIQTWVECQQQDNRSIYPQCSTYYKCGLTVLPAPAGMINRIDVVDRINPDTGLEDATADYDWCSAITYLEVPSIYMDRYLAASRAAGGCLPAALFFSLSATSCQKGMYSIPTPTDEGVPAGLPVLPLGYSYPQESTDATTRALSGVWAKSRGNILIAPWIQSTEQVVVIWDGIKRSFSDPETVSDNPLVFKAVQEWLRWDHFKNWDKDYDAAAAASLEYKTVLATLMHECREESRQRDSSSSSDASSHSRGSTSSIVSLYYNDADQNAYAECPAGTEGDAGKGLVLAGTVSSPISVADANRIAMEQAQAKAKAALVCEDVVVLVKNTVAGVYTATCDDEGDGDHPTPTGDPVTVTVEIDTVEAATIEAANLLAQQQAQEQAEALLECTYYNMAGSAEACCPTDDTKCHTVFYTARTHSSPIDEATADQLAHDTAALEAQTWLAINMACFAGNQLVYAKRFIDCRGGSGVETATEDGVPVYPCADRQPGSPCWYGNVYFLVAANKVYQNTQEDADAIAQTIAEQYADGSGRVQACTGFGANSYFNFNDGIGVYVPGMAP